MDLLTPATVGAFDAKRAGRSRVVGAIVALAGLLLALGAPSAQAQQSDIVRVSNLGQIPASSVFSLGHVATGDNVLWAQSFRTGGFGGGYSLSNVQALVGALGGSPTVRVSIYSDSSRFPGTSLYVLTSLTDTSAATDTFTAPAGATLAANTRYWVVFEVTSGSGSVALGTNDTANRGNEDADPSMGWSIDDLAARSPSEKHGWRVLGGMMGPVQ